MIFGGVGAMLDDLESLHRPYAISALVGAAIVVGASKGGTHSLAFPIGGPAVCFAIRLAGIYFELNVPRAPGAR